MDGLSIKNIDSTARGLGGVTGGVSEKSSSSSQKISNGTEGVDSFANTLKDAIKSVDSLQKDADIKIQKLATGQSTDIHGTMIASEKAEIALKFMIQVRNKIIDAYHEIMKMQV